MNQQLRTLVIKAYSINQVRLGDKVTYHPHHLIVPSMSHDTPLEHKYLHSAELTLIQPGEDKQINCIMDIMPLATKVLGTLGHGITHVFTGVYFMLTGGDVNGLQVMNFGSSDGLLSEQLYRGRAGTPAKDDIIIHMDVKLKADYYVDRQAVNAAHAYADHYVQAIRNVLKDLNSTDFDEKHVYVDQVRPGKPKVAIVKMVGAQGAMHDNMIMPNEPAGYAGGKSVVDVEGLPVILSPNEYRDGALRALT